MVAFKLKLWSNLWLFYGIHYLESSISKTVENLKLETLFSLGKRLNGVNQFGAELNDV